MILVTLCCAALYDGCPPSAYPRHSVFLRGNEEGGRVTAGWQSFCTWVFRQRCHWEWRFLYKEKGGRRNFRPLLEPANSEAISLP